MFRRLEKEKLRTRNIIDWENFTFEYKNKQIKINIPDEYPFKCPQLIIHDKDHIDWFLKEYIQFMSLKKLNITHKCICCDTIVCMWLPTYTIDQLINEYKIYYDNYEIIKSFQLFYNMQIFDDLIYQMIFLYIDI